MSLKIAQILARDQARLIETLGLEKREARLETQVLLSHALSVSKVFLIAHSDDHLLPEQEYRYTSLIERRLKGEPIAYILGEREFYSLPFKVTPAVLIPRPETELLVELALTYIAQDKPCQVLDLGTGSGAVAITIAKHRPFSSLTAVDHSADALAVARENAAKLGVNAIDFIQSDWYSALSVKKFDIIVANPPYISKNDPHLTQGDLRFEPRMALTDGQDGLACIRAIIAGASEHLMSNGMLFFEHGYDQASACQELLKQHGFEQITSHSDLGGISRITCGRRKEILG